MKFNQVIFGDLSNSGRKRVWIFSSNFWLTKYSRLPKEDVHNGNVFFIGIVGHPVLIDRIGFNFECIKFLLPLWAKLLVLPHSWSQGTCSSRDQIYCWHSPSSGFRRSQEHRAATLPRWSKTSCIMDSGSNSGSHRSFGNYMSRQFKRFHTYSCSFE